jgi:hypothetical protein
MQEVKRTLRKQKGADKYRVEYTDNNVIKLKPALMYASETWV